MKPVPLQRTSWFILAHCFNMDGRAASQTITDRLPAIMQAGVQPVVLSAPTGERDNRFPHFQVISPAPSGVLFELRYIIKKETSSWLVEKALKAVLLLACLPFLIIEKLIVPLDSQWSWFLSATVRGFFIGRKYRPKVIYSTAGPPSTHVAGFFLHKLLKTPWVAELHDPLIYDDERPGSHHYRFKQWIEKTVLGNAAAVIYFTDKAFESASRRHAVKGRAVVLRPGADSPNLSGVAYSRRDKLHLGYFGALAVDRNLAEIVKGLHAVFQIRPELRKRVCLDIYGTEPDSVTQLTLKRFPLGEALCLHGRLEWDANTKKSGRRKVLEAMRRSDVLLLLHGSIKRACQEYVPSKVYEYLLMRRPILGLVSRGSELELILSSTGHTVVDETDSKAVQAALRTIIEAWIISGLPDLEFESPFTLGKAVDRLLEVVRQITSAPEQTS